MTPFLASWGLRDCGEKQRRQGALDLVERGQLYLVKKAGACAKGCGQGISRKGTESPDPEVPLLNRRNPGA